MGKQRFFQEIAKIHVKEQKTKDKLTKYSFTAFLYHSVQKTVESHL